MTTNTFIGPDGRAYAEHKPEEGGFLSYFDGSMWLITFPVRDEFAHTYFYHGDHLPTSAKQWETLPVHTRSPLPAFAMAD